MTRAVVAVAALLGAGVFATAAGAAPLVVHARFETSKVQFGGVIDTQVVVVLDRALVRPGSLRFVEDAAPLTPLSPQQASRAVQGGSLVVVFRRTFSCLSSACISPTGDATPSLPPATATAVTRDGRTLRARAAWPTLHVRGRITKADLAPSRPPFLADTTPRSPSYRIAPSTLALLLDVLAVFLGLGAVALAAIEGLRSARRRRRTATTDELERALRLAREAETRPPPDRRRALGLLARVLEGRDRRRAGTARDLAWAKPDPPRESVALFVADVERDGG